MEEQTCAVTERKVLEY